VFMLKGTPLRYGRVTHLKRFFFENLYFLLPAYIVHENLFCGTIICPLSIWQLGLKLECYCLTGKSVTIILMLFPQHRYKTSVKGIAIRQDILWYHKIDYHVLHTSTTRKNWFTTRLQSSPFKTNTCQTNRRKSIRNNKCIIIKSKTFYINKANPNIIWVSSKQ